LGFAVFRLDHNSRGAVSGVDASGL
jgi:hypothetical protein